jgi:hypothetical protein
VGGETWGKVDHLEDPDIDRRAILERDLKGTQWDGVGSIHLACKLLRT